MSKFHILSNRLPSSIVRESGSLSLVPSVGGLATGMKSIYKKFEGSWIGWPGITLDECEPGDVREMEHLLQQEQCVPVHLTRYEMNMFYEGFSNKTIWPLFHYFPQYVEYNQETWDVYVAVNRLFADIAIAQLEDGDSIWVHDYQLLLVPQMIKEAKPSVTVGFFLHIPFPSFEVFRILPWRLELLQGMLGADLLGFHTYDYERHFFSCVRRLLGLDISMNLIQAKDRMILVDAFPMGIDFDRFHNAAASQDTIPEEERSEFRKQIDDFVRLAPERKLILSIDRLDYSKGIPHRLRAFARFLELYPEYQHKVTLVMLAVPSRSEVDQYQWLKKEVDELVGSINGRFGGINYSPVWYFYRSLPFQQLVELYHHCEIALITPVRDGMNLVAKEYVASRIHHDGVMILSEMAGAAKEMGEAIIINPNNEEDVARAIARALSMPVSEQRERMLQLQTRVRRYDVFKWSDEFVRTMFKTQTIQKEFNARRLSTSVAESIEQRYSGAKRRVLFLDYDGTLVPFTGNPALARPDDFLLNLLSNLAHDPMNLLVIISGRDKDTLTSWFDGLPIHLVAEHGVWVRKIGGEWKMPQVMSSKWMPDVRRVMEAFVDRTPGTFIETKNFSLVWHYRNAEPEQAEKRAFELKDELMDLIANMNIEILEGNKVIEVKVGGVNKGTAALQMLAREEADFIMAVGDDWTDEYMFRELPPEAVTIRVGVNRTSASYKVDNLSLVRTLLERLSNVKQR